MHLSIETFCQQRLLDKRFDKELIQSSYAEKFRRENCPLPKKLLSVAAVRCIAMVNIIQKFIKLFDNEKVFGSNVISHARMIFNTQKSKLVIKLERC